LAEKEKKGFTPDITTYDKNFISWFVGFTEADGCFLINKNRYLEFRITQSSIDKEVLFYIKKCLSFGVVRPQCSKSKTSCYRVRDKGGILCLITIFNNYGYLFTEEKRNQFNHWVDSFNAIYKTNIVNYTLCNGIGKKVHLNDGWLSGFTDGYGCFTVTVCKQKQTKHSLYTQVQVRYIVSQKNNKHLMESIAACVNGKVQRVDSYSGYNMVVNLSSLSTIISYLRKYPLKTKKRESFKKWLRVYFLVKHKKHFISAHLQQIKETAKTINRRDSSSDSF